MFKENQSLIDWQAFRERVADDEFIVDELCEAFIAHGPSQLATIEEAIRKADARSLERAAHAFKSPVAMLGIQTAINAMLNLEEMGRNSKLDRANAEFLQLKQSIHIVIGELLARRLKRTS